MLSKKFYLMAALTTFGCAQTPDIEDENNVILPIDASLCYGSTCRFTYTEIDKADAVHFFQPQNGQVVTCLDPLSGENTGSIYVIKFEYPVGGTASASKSLSLKCD